MMGPFEKLMPAATWALSQALKYNSQLLQFKLIVSQTIPDEITVFCGLHATVASWAMQWWHFG
jgi:hypothetical protein